MCNNTLILWRHLRSGLYITLLSLSHIPFLFLPIRYHFVPLVVSNKNSLITLAASRHLNERRRDLLLFLSKDLIFLSVIIPFTKHHIHYVPSCIANSISEHLLNQDILNGYIPNDLISALLVGCSTSNIIH